MDRVSVRDGWLSLGSQKTKNLDGLWAALVSHTRTGRYVKEAFAARLSAMARLSPALAVALDVVRFVPPS